MHQPITPKRRSSASIGTIPSSLETDAGNYSVVSVPVQAGRSYTIRVGGYNGATGAGQLTLSVQSASSENLLVSFEATTSVPGLPLVLCGALKIAYDVALLFSFRHVKPPEEQGALRGEEAG